MAIKNIGKLINEDNAINPANLLLLYEYSRVILTEWKCFRKKTKRRKFDAIAE